MALRRVVDVRPAIAVATADARDVYLAAGFVVESPLHPLHRKIFRRGEPERDARLVVRGRASGARAA